MPLFHCELCGMVITAARGADVGRQQLECPACSGTMRRAFHAPDPATEKKSIIGVGAPPSRAADGLLATGGE